MPCLTLRLIFTFNKISLKIVRQLPRRARGCRFAAAGQTTSGKACLGAEVFRLATCQTLPGLWPAAHSAALCVCAWGGGGLLLNRSPLNYHVTLVFRASRALRRPKPYSRCTKPRILQVCNFSLESYHTNPNPSL